MRFAKGHGTGNDFVVLPDPDGALALTPHAVRLLCDRHRGVGGDGVLRVVPTAKVAEVAHLAADAEWFMDYRNADGTLAEMCGNGIRVYARWLAHEGLLAPGPVPVATRDGVKVVRPTGDGYAVALGRPEVRERSRTVAVGDRTWEGREVWIGNPHVVVTVADLADAGALLAPPVVEPALETNVEFVVPRGPGRFAMRVHERGSGETQSCGTGACAAVAAVAHANGRESGSWTVEIPGGQVTVTLSADGAELAGPADIVASGELAPGFVAQLGPLG